LVNTPPKLLGYLKQEIPLDLFDEVLSSCEAGLMKPDLRFFEMMVEKLKIRPEDCLFIDDSQKNVEAAAKLGMQVIRFENYQSLKKELGERGII